jgi:hypothetical protein
MQLSQIVGLSALSLCCVPAIPPQGLSKACDMSAMPSLLLVGVTPGLLQYINTVRPFDAQPRHVIALPPRCLAAS